MFHLIESINNVYPLHADFYLAFCFAASRAGFAAVFVDVTLQTPQEIGAAQGKEVVRVRGREGCHGGAPAARRGGVTAVGMAAGAGAAGQQAQALAGQQARFKAWQGHSNRTATT
jgi:hypothetical protein